eukprot:1397768-Pyramimonas_sp.AAC.1
MEREMRRLAALARRRRVVAIRFTGRVHQGSYSSISFTTSIPIPDRTTTFTPSQAAASLA